jgi:hypothetical protein
MDMSDARLRLRMKATQLIAADREAHKRDASHLRRWERDIEEGLAAMARLMREGLKRLTAAGY